MLPLSKNYFQTLQAQLPCTVLHNMAKARGTSGVLEGSTPLLEVAKLFLSCYGLHLCPPPPSPLVENRLDTLFHVHVT